MRLRRLYSETLATTTTIFIRAYIHTAYIHTYVDDCMSTCAGIYNIQVILLQYHFLLGLLLPTPAPSAPCSCTNAFFAYAYRLRSLKFCFLHFCACMYYVHMSECVCVASNLVSCCLPLSRFTLKCIFFSTHLRCRWCRQQLPAAACIQLQLFMYTHICVCVCRQKRPSLAH